MFGRGILWPGENEKKRKEVKMFIVNQFGYFAGMVLIFMLGVVAGHLIEYESDTKEVGHDTETKEADNGYDLTVDINRVESNNN